MPITGPYPGIFNTAASEMLVSHTTFSGSIINTGSIGTGGIVVISSTLLSGGIIDTGVDAGGISVDSASRINAPNATAIAVTSTATFAGGITNAGALSGGRGILVGATTGVHPPVGTFSGGIVNSGKISAATTGLGIVDVATVMGGIVNNGTIVGSTCGIFISSAGVVSGGIAIGSQGVISAGHFGILIQNASTFAGGIVNRGKISATSNGAIIVTDVAILGNTSPGGGITNSGTISGAGGIIVQFATAVYRRRCQRRHDFHDRHRDRLCFRRQCAGRHRQQWEDRGVHRH